ncbi:hypothetical protein LIER_06469 [Lithospermum erythrorhizon]|uniref:Uncharacterized protein n=1 Tax=Lithospermum erythrorhizon TaxID=34254 RepID=A0AAV3P4G9_LITER
MKGQKRKKTEGKYEREESEQIVEDEAEEEMEEAMKSEGTTGNVDEQGDEVLDEVPDIHLVPCDGSKKPELFLSRRMLPWKLLKSGRSETACFLSRFLFNGNSYDLLNSQKHHEFLKRHNRNPSNYRPDIAFECVSMITIAMEEKWNIL